MSPVSCVGTSGSGKSTLVGLMGQQMNRKALKDPKAFSYYISRDVCEELLTKTKNRMLSGWFPQKTMMGELDTISFLMGFYTSKWRKIKEIFRNSKREGLPNLNSILEFQKGFILNILDIAGEDVEKIGQPLQAQEQKVMRRIKTLFSANILVMIVDASRFTNQDNGAKAKVRDMRSYDTMMTKILSRVIQFRKENELDNKVIPIVFLTKMDALDNSILRSVELEDVFSDKERLFNYPYNESKVQEIGDTLLKSYMPDFREILYGGDIVGVELGYPKYFFSGLYLEGKGGEEVGDNDIASEFKEDSQGEYLTNIYTKNHYEEFLDYLQTLSREYSDSKNLMKKYIKQTEKGEVLLG